MSHSNDPIYGVFKFQSTPWIIMRQTSISISYERFQTESRDLLIINVSPLEFGASLLVPEVDSCLPQVLFLSIFSFWFLLMVERFS